MLYGQNQEDKWITEYFANKPSGKFVDIGSYDVFRFSNVRALFEAGNWTGVMVEPSPPNFKSISKFYKDEPKIEVLNFAVGPENGEIDFYESGGDAVSTSDEGHMQKWGAAGVKYKKIKVPQMKTEDFFDKYGHGADFLSIDTESTNILVFRQVPDWVWSQISCVCVEHDGFLDEIRTSLSKYGFSEIHVNAENIILAKINE